MSDNGIVKSFFRDYNTESFFKLLPDAQYIFGVWRRLGSSDVLSCYNIINDTIEINYSGLGRNYNIGHDFWFSNNSKYFYTKSGYIYQIPSLINSAFTLVGQFEVNRNLYEYNNLVYVEHYPLKHLIFCINQYPKDPFDNEFGTEISIHNDESFIYVGSCTYKSFYKTDLNGEVQLFQPMFKYIFINQNETKLYAIARVAEGSGLLNEWSIQIIDLE